MKKIKTKIQIQLEQLSPKERKAILKWIDTLSDNEVKAFSDLEGLKLAQTILETFLRKRNTQTKNNE